MPVLMLVAAVVILAGVVVVASGRGGEMVYEDPDYPPIDLGPVSAADVALLRPPSAAWGYNMRVTDEALEVIAKAVTERDVQISALQQELADLRQERSPEWAATKGAHRAGPGDAAPAETAGTEARAEARAEAGTAVVAGTAAAGPETPEPSWPTDEPATGGVVPVTRPQPIYRDPGEPGAAAPPPWDPPGGQGGEPGDADLGHSAPGGTDAPGDTDAPHVTWEAPSPPSVWDAASRPQTPGASPSPGEAQAWQAPHPPSVWDTASQPEPARETAAEAEPGWDEAPHQQLVWGAANQQAKAARAAEDTAPHAPGDDAPPEPAPGPQAPSAPAAGPEAPAAHDDGPAGHDGPADYDRPAAHDLPGQYQYDVPARYRPGAAPSGPEDDRE